MNSRDTRLGQWLCAISPYDSYGDGTVGRIADDNPGGMPETTVSTNLFHGVDLLVDELGLGQERVGRRVVFFEFQSQPLGVRQDLLNGDGHG